MELTPEICGRFYQLRKEHPDKLSREDFGRMLGISGEMVRNLEIPGRMTNVREDTIRLTCDVFRVNPEWLINGTGEMHRPGLIPELAHVLRGNPALQAMLTSMVERMDAADWAALNAVVEKVLKKE